MITVYLKSTNFCNVGCLHCYLPEEVRANKDKMNDETLHKVMIFLKEMQIKEKKDRIFFLWHGGEPLVLSPDYFYNAGKIIDSYFESNMIYESIQTSLIPYKKEFAPLVKERWNSFIGTSIDFSSRLIKGSFDDYAKLWMSKVELARNDNIIVVPSMTPSKSDCYNAKWIYNWFKERKFEQIAMDRYSNIAGTLPNFPTNKEHSKFLQDLLDLCFLDFKSGITPLKIRPIIAGVRGVLYDMPGDRWGGSCQSDFIVINPDGKLNNCPDKDSFEPSYGHLNEGFMSFKSAPMRKKWIRIQQAEHRVSDCYTCENASWCKSGCPITNNFCSSQNNEDECSGYIRFINHIRNYLVDTEKSEFIKLYANEKLFKNQYD